MDAVFREQHPGYSDAPKIGTAEQIAESLEALRGARLPAHLLRCSGAVRRRDRQPFVGEVKPMLEQAAIAAAGR